PGDDLLEGAGQGRGDLGVDLVGGDLEEALVDLDGVALLLEPLGDGALGDGFAEFGHRHVGAATAAATSGVTTGAAAGGLLRGGRLRCRPALVGDIRPAVVGGGGCGVVGAPGSRAVIDETELPADLDGLVLPGDDLLERARGRGGYLR